MRKPRSSTPVLVAAALMVATGGWADTPTAKGKYSVGGPLEFQDAVALHRTDWEGRKLVVVLLQRPVDRARLAQTLDVEGVVEAAKAEPRGRSWSSAKMAPG